MKRIGLLMLLVVTFGSAAGQGNATATFTTSGNKILDPCGNVFIPRGINYALLDDWDFPGNLNTGAELSAQIVQAHPNTVRIQWYLNYGQPSRPSFSLSDLDSVVSRFERAGVVTILELHDVTCTNNVSSFQQIIQYWTSSNMINLIQKHQKSIMVNIANEYGQVEWTVNPTIAYNEWLADYQTAIGDIRQAGIRVPLIIDAPDCGISINWILQAATDLLAADSLQSLILSVHAYFASYTASQMQSLVTAAANSNIPVIFGEIANIQDAVAPCSDTITTYPALLESCENHTIGWLAWVWTDDYCDGRRLSSNGLFSNLTAYGNDIVNNPTYGLIGHAAKACFDVDSGTAATDINASQSQLLIYPNPAKDHLTVQLHSPNETSGRVSLWTTTGQRRTVRDLPSGRSGTVTLDIEGWPAGIYWLQYTNGATVIRKKFIKY